MDPDWESLMRSARRLFQDGPDAAVAAEVAAARGRLKERGLGHTAPVVADGLFAYSSMEDVGITPVWADELHELRRLYQLVARCRNILPEEVRAVLDRLDLLVDLPD